MIYPNQKRAGFYEQDNGFSDGAIFKTGDCNVEVVLFKREREKKECFQTGKTKTTKALRLNRRLLKPQTHSCTLAIK